MKSTLLLLTLITLVFTSCMTKNKLAKTGIDEIHFGSGGGFTGEVKTYILTAGNKILELDNELKKVDSKTTLAIFNEAKEIKDYSFNEPENMYSFIEIKTKDKTNRIVWAFGSTTVDKKVIELHKKLMNLIK